MASYTSTGSAGSDERRIVLIGRTGSGKSSAAITISGREAVKTELSTDSETTKCKKERGEVGGRKVTVVDPPGLFDTGLSIYSMWEITRCINMSSPGPHAFLVIVQLGTFTEEERETMKMIRKGFGEDADKYTMVLFTYGDTLKKQTIEAFISKSKDLQDIIEKCHGRYHVFNNQVDDPSQVSQLLQKIDKMVEDNGGTHYTTEMYKTAEEEIEKAKEKILKESEVQRNKELEELKAKFTGEMLEMEKEMLKLRYEAEARARAELQSFQLPVEPCVII